MLCPPFVIPAEPECPPSSSRPSQNGESRDPWRGRALDARPHAVTCRWSSCPPQFVRDSQARAAAKQRRNDERSQASDPPQARPHRAPRPPWISAFAGMTECFAEMTEWGEPGRPSAPLAGDSSAHVERLEGVFLRTGAVVLSRSRRSRRSGGACADPIREMLESDAC